MSRSSREAIPNVRELTGSSPGCPGVVERTSRMALTNIREWLGGPPEYPSFWEALPDVRKWSGGHPGCPRVVGSPSCMSGSCREAVSEVWEPLPDDR